MAMRVFVSAGILAVAAGLLAQGCGKEAAAPSPTTPSPGSAPSAPSAPAPTGGAYDPATATAVLRVRATVEGSVPAMRPIKFDADPQCHAAHTTTAYRESIVAVDGKLANVIAWVSKGTEGRTYATPSEPVVLDQKGCMYLPHVFTVHVNQRIVIRNSDATMHNVHAVPDPGKGNEEFNKPQDPGAADLTEKFGKPEVAVKFKCDKHDWMETWAGVLPHPFHGVTDSTGTTVLKVPPGDYEVSAWQESDKLVRPAPVTVTVARGETKEIGFVFKVIQR